MLIGTARAIDDHTLATVERQRGVVGPAPADDRTEIRWARLDDIEVVVKAGSEDLRDRLRREAEVLRRCEHQRVVGIIDLVDGPDHTELVTRRFGSVTLGETGLLDPSERGRALVDLCDAVEELHASGWTHGSLSRGHVLVDPGQGVALCSMGDAVELGGARSATELSADRDALASVVSEVLGEPAGFESRRVRRRWNRSASKAAGRLGAARGLRSPAQVRAVLVGGGLPGAGEGRDTSPPTGRTAGARWHVPVAAAAIVLAILVALGVALRDGPAVAEAFCPDVDADGSCDRVRIDGQQIEVAGRRFEVGLDGDVPRLGDWDCDGRATVALLRPSTGDLFTFEGWAGAGDPLDGELLGTFEGAVGIVEPDACGPPRLQNKDGSIESVAPSPRATGQGG